MKRPILLRVNGEEHRLEIEPNELLLDVLRDKLALTGTKEGCSVGICGTCTVLLDGKRVSSCLTLAVLAEGVEVTTIEGLAGPDGLDPVQQAFIEKGGFQCGFCTSGMIMATKELLSLTPNPTDEQIKEGLDNLCRCTGYYNIIKSVRRAADAQQGKGSSLAR